MTEPSRKALSQKPLGYILAILGGTLGGPIGWLSSPLVLFGLTQVMKEKNGKQPNRFLVWALIGIIGAPLSVASITGFSSEENVTTSPSPITESRQLRQTESANERKPDEQKHGVTMANYKRLETGMTYEQVVEILGKQGTEMSSNDIAGYKTVMYMWKSGRFSVGNMNAMFQNGGLVQKAQFGLR
jgi:Domain of Unknown Function with PDB structure (DUF3862)